jgi:hypothetical protein
LLSGRGADFWYARHSEVRMAGASGEEPQTMRTNWTVLVGLSVLLTPGLVYVWWVLGGPLMPALLFTWLLFGGMWVHASWWVGRHTANIPAACAQSLPLQVRSSRLKTVALLMGIAGPLSLGFAYQEALYSESGEPQLVWVAALALSIVGAALWEHWHEGFVFHEDELVVTRGKTTFRTPWSNVGAILRVFQGQVVLDLGFGDLEKVTVEGTAWSAWRDGMVVHGEKWRTHLRLHPLILNVPAEDLLQALPITIEVDR